jgi:hypothetical protein
MRRAVGAYVDLVCAGPARDGELQRVVPQVSAKFRRARDITSSGVSNSRLGAASSVRQWGIPNI